MSMLHGKGYSGKSGNGCHTGPLRLVGALPLLVTVAVAMCGCGRRDEAKERDSRTGPIGSSPAATRPGEAAEPPSEGLRALLAQLKSGDAEQRLAAIDELSVDGSRQALQAIAGVTQDEDTRVACRALLAVASSRLENRRKYIMQAAKDPRPEVRRVAMVGIGRLNDKRKDAKMLAEVVRRRDEDPQVRAAAAQALGKLRAWDQRAALIGALRDPSPRVRGSAAAALRRMTGRDFHFRANDPPAKREAAVRQIEQLLR